MARAIEVHLGPHSISLLRRRAENHGVRNKACATTQNSPTLVSGQAWRVHGLSCLPAADLLNRKGCWIINNIKGEMGVGSESALREGVPQLVAPTHATPFPVS